LKVKEKIKARMTRVIKETSFDLYCLMSNLLYHLRSLKVHSIAALNAHRHLVFQGTPSFDKDGLNKDETHGHKESQ